MSLALRSRRPQRMRRAITAAAAAAILSIASVTVVSADPWGTYDFNTGTGPKPDNGQHTWCIGNAMPDNVRLGAYYAMGNSVDYFTDMSSVQEACQNTTDVIFFAADLPAGVRGAYQCEVWTNFANKVCNRGSVFLDQAEINIGANDHEDSYKSACHEVGHSVGLTHVNGGDDCMRNGEIPNTNAQYRNFNAHHRSHINTNF